MKKYLIIVLSIIILLIFLQQHIIHPTMKKTKTIDKQITKAINNGLLYLQRKQLNYGGFKTQMCKTEHMNNCQKIHTLFFPVNIFIAIEKIKSKKINFIYQKSFHLFKKEQDKNNLWDFYPNQQKYDFPKEEVDQSTLKVYFPDLDDSSLISYFLEKNHQKFRNNKKIIEQNKKNGLYITFLKTHQPPFPHKDNIDIVVNANVLMYLQKNDKKICNFITKSINNRTDNSIYYQDKIVRYYFISRAYKNNIICLKESKTTIVNYLKTKQQSSGAFGNPMQTALAITTLLNFGYNKNKLKKSIKYLLTQQKKEGNWQKAAFHKGPEFSFGSNEMSTAIVLEALNNYIQFLQKQ